MIKLIKIEIENYAGSILVSIWLVCHTKFDKLSRLIDECKIINYYR